jgi:DNA-binding NtrC family response regulator
MQSYFIPMSKVTNKPVVFIVEDDNFYNTLLSTYLKSKDFPVYSFLSGEECLAKTDVQPDIVISDYILTGINGVDLMHKMRPQAPNAEFIILSGQTDIKVALKALSEGAYDYIVKDNHAKENALNKIDQVLRYRKMRQEKDLYKKSVIFILAALIISLIVIFVYYQFVK